MLASVIIQLYFGFASAVTTVGKPCNPCLNFPDGPYKGLYTLEETNYPLCTDGGCLYTMGGEHYCYGAGSEIIELSCDPTSTSAITTSTTATTTDTTTSTTTASTSTTTLDTSPVDLTSDSGCTYFKVPVKHGVALDTGAVGDTCKSQDEDPVCFHDGNHVYNVPGCRHTEKGGYIFTVLAELICNTADASQCPALRGLYTATVNSGTDGECGINKDGWCVKGSDHTSGPGEDYSSSSKSAQYYALCCKPKE